MKVIYAGQFREPASAPKGFKKSIASREGTKEQLLAQETVCGKPFIQNKCPAFVFLQAAIMPLKPSAVYVYVNELTSYPFTEKRFTFSFTNHRPI